uniref:Nucleolar protein 15 n=1 Tax=Tetraselmis sp. GSL018 TaxID=582737 RepID=A0A061QJ77_9CHLO|mmetsp:Transcript_2740/g.6394  ORF Transcript_2740/g.6394 Transcript_2740/m.6394 type:complete len:213 (+) Transcript_2740:96-734(+)
MVLKRAAGKRKSRPTETDSVSGRDGKAKKADEFRGEEADETAQLPSSSDSEDSSVVYIGHIPHGFYEKELKGFFSQFGDVERWRVSRNKRTGRSKGYAFVKFEHPEVAKIAAEAMDGYHMFKQSLKCQVMKKRDVHPELFNKSNKVLEMKPWRKIEAEQHNKQRTPEQAQQRNLRAIKRDKRRLQQIQSAGLDFEYESLQEKLPKGPTHKKF